MTRITRSRAHRERGKGSKDFAIPKLPPLRRNQVRCPMCLGPTGLTRNPGRLLSHNAPDGFPCMNRAANGNIPTASLPPRLRVAAESPPVVDTRGNAAKRTGACIDCDKWLPGERVLCGQCARKREAARR